MQTRKIADILKNAEQREASLASQGTRGRFFTQSMSAVGVAPALDAGQQTSSERVFRGGSSYRPESGIAPGHATQGAGSNTPKENQARLLLEELAGLESRCASLAERLSDVVRELQSGRVPAEGPGPEIATLRRDVEALQEKTVELAGLLSVPAEAATGPSVTLAGLRVVLEQVVEALQRQAFRDRHARAALELKGVLRLEYQDGRGFVPLADCKTGARKLLAEIEGAKWPDSHPDCLTLVERRHAYSQLLDFVRHGEELSDSAWETAQEALANSFGKPLSIAAVRGRLHEDGDTAGLAEALRRCPACNADIDADSRFCGECGVGVE
ncbi:MAG TPA: zinc ribbon domain-containing protein [Terriglobia bacterium]|nr:zinc ribbon domain-containing protein [Terriglobia bacterium]